MRVPLVSLGVLHAVRVETWRALFEAVGAPPGIGARATHDDIGRALDPEAHGAHDKTLPPKLRASLGTLGWLASPRGREALHDAAAALAHDTRRWPHAATDAELAAELLVRAAREPVIAEICELACVDLRQTTRPQLFRIFQGARGASSAIAWPPSREDLAAFASDLEREAASRVPGGPVVARAFTSVESPEHLGIELSRAHAPQASPRGPGRRPPRSEGAGSSSTDLVIVDRARDWLLVRPSHAWLLPFLRRRAGLLLHGDEAHYTISNPVRLAVLLDRGAAALDVPALSATITRARLIRVVWDKGERGMSTIDAADVFEELAKTGDPFARGQVRSATIRLTLAAGEPRAIDVHLQAPNRLHVEASPHDGAVYAFLDASGLVGGARPPDDLWSLAPWVHARATWIASFGEAALDALIAEGSLVRAQSRALAHPDHPHAGRALIAFPRAGARHYGVSEDDDVPSILLEESALETWRLDPVALGRRLARALALEGSARAVERVEGLVEVGRRAIGPVDVRVFLLAARPGERALAEVLAALPGRARPVLLVPRGRSLSSLAPVVGVDLAAPREALLRDVVVALRLEDEVEAIVVAPPGARVVVDEARELAWLDGAALELTATDLALLRALARAGGASLSYAALTRAVGSGPRDGSALPKQKHHLVAQMRESFTKLRRPLPGDLDRLIESASGKHGYRLTVRSFVR